MATQNPIEMEGTYPLPEAQFDRFLMKILVTYPSREELNRIVERTIQTRTKWRCSRSWIEQQILELQAFCRQVMVAPHVQDYAIELSWRRSPARASAHELTNRYIRYGSSPRGAQALVECGRVMALMRGRIHLSIDDISAVAAASCAIASF